MEGDMEVEIMQLIPLQKYLIGLKSRLQLWWGKYTVLSRKAISVSPICAKRCSIFYVFFQGL